MNRIASDDMRSTGGRGSLPTWPINGRLSTADSVNRRVKPIAAISHPCQNEGVGLIPFCDSMDESLL